LKFGTVDEWINAHLKLYTLPWIISRKLVQNKNVTS
jgi:hypothetical protein